MYKYLAFSLVVLLLGLLQACEQGSASQQKIGVVNINRIMVDSDAGKAAAKYMEELQDSLRGQLTQLQSRVSQQNAAGEKKAEDKGSEEALQKEVQAAYAKLQAEQQNVQSILNDVLHRTVDKFRKDKGFAMILFSDMVLSFSDSVDVTSAITDAMNAEKVEFKPLPAPKAQTPKAEGSKDEPAAKDAPKPEEKKDEKSPAEQTK